MPDRSDELREFRHSAREFAESFLAAGLLEWDRSASIPQASFPEFARLGLLGLHVPAALGGGGRDLGFGAIVAEELGRVGATDPCTSLLPISTIVAPMLARGGSGSTARALLESIIAGETVASIAITEPSGGSDLAGAVKTIARRQRDGWVLNGEKMFITNAPIADVLLVMAATEPRHGLLGMTVFVVPADAAGVEISSLEKLGLHSSPTGRIRFDSCRLGEEAQVGRLNRGYAELSGLLRHERLLAAIGGGAVVRSALLLALDASQRSPLGFGARQWLLPLLGEAEAGLVYCSTLACGEVAGEPDRVGVCLAKARLGDLARRATASCWRHRAEMSPAQQRTLLRLIRDVRAVSVFAGSSETMRDFAGASIVQAARRRATIEAGR